MDKLFFSKDNFNLLSQIIGIKIKEQYNTNLDSSHNKTILSSMNYVFSNINPKPPKNMSINKYLDMMNIKCLSIVMPQIQDSFNKPVDNQKYKQPPLPEFPQPSNNEFDDQLNTQFKPEMLPIPTINPHTDNITEKFESLQDSRSQESQQHNEIISEQKEVPPSLEDTNSRFNIRLQERKLTMPQSTQPMSHKSVQRQMQQTFTQEKLQDQLKYQNQMQQPIKTDLSNLDQYFPDASTINFTNSTENPLPFNENDDVAEPFIHQSRQKIQQYQHLDEEKHSVKPHIQQDKRDININRQKIIDKTLESLEPPVKTNTINTSTISVENDIVTIDPEEKNRIKSLQNTLAYNPNSISNTVSPVILPQKPQYIRKVKYFTIDSRDRDLEIYPNPSFFQVKFAPATDDIITNCINVKTQSQCIVYVIREDVSGERGASITRVYDNIFYLQCTQAIVPLESIFVCGICPNRYYSNDIDTACQGGEGVALNDRVLPLEKNTNKAIWNNKIGIQTTVLDIPYLALNIEELESYSPYSGTNTTNRNAFAKLVYDTNFGILSPYIKMTTSETDEYYTYSPTALGNIDKFTISLLTPEGEIFFFGRDQLFIDRFERSPNFLKNCPSGIDPITSDIVGVNATRIFINKDKSFCKCIKKCLCREPLDSHCLKPGDLIYLYNTRPCKPTYIMFHDVDSQISFNNYNLIINNEVNGVVDLSINIVTDVMNNIEEPIDFTKFLKVDNYLALRINNKDEFYNILALDGTNVTVENNASFELMEGAMISKVGFANQNNKGFLTPNRDDLTFQGGIRVCAVGDNNLCGNPKFNVGCEASDPNCDSYNSDDPGSAGGLIYNPTDPTPELFFDVDYAFDNLREQFLGENYKEGQVFLIKQKLQISYTFKVVTLEKDYNILESLLIGP